MSAVKIAVVLGCWLLPPLLILVAHAKQRNRARAWRQQDELLAHMLRRRR